MIYLYVSTFGKSVSWIKFPNTIPIEVGCSCRDSNHPIIYSNKDNKGDNISIDNPYYGELTGLYYIWKNIHFNKNDVIGFAHYNKILNISVKELNKIFLEEKAWVTHEPEIIGPHRYPNDVTALISILKQKYPKYYTAWNKLYLKNGASRNADSNCETCQMFFTSKEEFDKYCNFLFNVLDLVRKKIGNVNRAPYHKRYCAFIGERLLSVYLKTNSRRVHHVPVIYTGETKLGIFIKNRMNRHNIHFQSNLKIVRILKNIFLGKRHSSYR